MRTQIVNISGDYEESTVQLARHLGTSKLRRALFKAIYGRGDKYKTKKELMKLANIVDKGTSAQQVQNELDYLAKHHLILKVRNEGRLDDGSRNLYGKDPTIRANKERILRLADDPKLATRVPTKRSPIRTEIIRTRRTSIALLRRQKKLKVLYLAANPEPAAPLRVDVEVRRVQDAIRSSRFRDNVEIEYRPAADLAALVQGLNDHRPTIVHFSGHSSSTGVGGDNQSVESPGPADISYATFARALGAVDTPPRIVVLNSCDSIESRDELLSSVSIVIGMNAPISDIAAATFAPHFYSALASGQSVQSAFEQARMMVNQVSLNEDQTIELAHAAAVDPRMLKLT